MNKEMKNKELLHFFTRWLTIAFSDIQLFDRDVVLYIAELLSRFARSENMYHIRKLPPKKLETVVEILIEAELKSNIDNPEFDPFSERDIRNHIADFTLFMTGIFREYIQQVGILDLYFRKGSESYKRVYEFDATLAKPNANIFNRLHRKFEYYSGGIDYMKKVYFDHKMPPGLPKEIIHGFYSG